VHGALNGRVHAMRDHVRTLAAAAPGVRATTFYADPLPNDAGRFDISGLVSARWLVQHTPAATATYYVCGPRPFLRDLITGLTAEGVPAERIRYEFFGPADELLTPPPAQLAA
jgi:nitric oxide dioxygenase